jgi:hypothetical protein
MQLEINGIDLGPPYRATSARPPAVFSFLTTPASPAPHQPTLPRWPAPSSSSPHHPAPPLQAPPTARPRPRRRHRPTAGRHPLLIPRRPDLLYTPRILISAVEVVLRHFHRCRYWSSTDVVLLLEGLRSSRSWLTGNMVDTKIYVVRPAGA